MYGALGAALGLAGMAIAVQVPSLNKLLLVAYPLAILCGVASMFGIYAFLWILPESQNMINGIAGASMSASERPLQPT